MIKNTFNLTEAMIKKFCSQKTFERALEYIDSVDTLKLRGDCISVKVYGSMPSPYRVNVCINANEWYRGQSPLNLPMSVPLSNHFVEGMRKIYELEPFIKMESSLADERGKGSKIYKKAI